MRLKKINSWERLSRKRNAKSWCKIKEKSNSESTGFSAFLEDDYFYPKVHGKRQQTECRTGTRVSMGLEQIQDPFPTLISWEVLVCHLDATSQL